MSSRREQRSERAAAPDGRAWLGGALRRDEHICTESMRHRHKLSPCVIEWPVRSLASPPATDRRINHLPGSEPHCQCRRRRLPLTACRCRRRDRHCHRLPPPAAVCQRQAVVACRREAVVACRCRGPIGPAERSWGAAVGVLGLGRGFRGGRVCDWLRGFEVGLRMAVGVVAPARALLPVVEEGDDFGEEVGGWAMEVSGRDFVQRGGFRVDLQDGGSGAGRGVREFRGGIHQP
jgi:hypothetical protein